MPSPGAAGSPRASARRATAPNSSSRPRTATRHSRSAWRSSSARLSGGLAAVARRAGRSRQRGRRAGGSRVIRLGSLAGYPFEGPRALAGWTPPARPAVYAVVFKPEPAANPERYAVIFVGQSDDLSTERFPFQHPRASCWVRRAGQVGGLHLHLRGARRAAITPGADRAGADRRLPAWLQPRAVRPGMEGGVDRRVPGAHHRAADHGAGSCGWRLDLVGVGT